MYDSRKRTSATLRHRVAFALVPGVLGLAACDLSVTNPGPLEDRFVNRPEAHLGLVNGMGRALSDGVNWVALTGAAVSKEVVGAGNLIAFGISLNQRQGRFVPTEIIEQWDRAQRARWMAEDGIRRMRETLGAEFGSSPLAARALVYAGYANRLLGENFCEAVIDGGPAEPRGEYFERAEAQFTEAIAAAQASGESTLAMAARAGRAAVRVWRDDWAGAVADANQVPEGFVYEARMTTVNIDEYNRIQFAVANQPFRTISTVNTFYDPYHVDTGDPRTPWDLLPGFPYGDSGDPPVPFHRQRKYTERDDGIPLSKGTEMRLILAEAALRDGDWPRAMQIINDRRQDLGLDPWAPTSLEEAWTHLKRERGIELWLEGRRLGDIHRWRANGTPGANPDDTGQDSCFPIAQSELDTNPRL